MTDENDSNVLVRQAAVCSSRETIMLEWSKNPPSQPGFYWVLAAGAPEVVHVDAYAVADDSGLLVWCVGESAWFRLSECDGWRWWPARLDAPHFEGDR
jgi:hypothetical protein